MIKNANNETTHIIGHGHVHKGREHRFFQKKTIVTSVLHPRKVDDDAGDIWIKCPKCHELNYSKEYFRSFKVCQKCKHHSRLRWQERVNLIVDEGSWVEVNSEVLTSNPLNFASDGEVYPDKVSQTRRKSGINESLVTGYGTIDGMPIALAIADFAFLGASMGSVYGEKMVRLIDLCIERRMPLLTVSASGGARMHEGLFSLMQMAKTTSALGLLGKARLPHFSLLTDPCYGGVSASYAMVADVMLAEPGAMVGFAGPRVIEQTTRQKLPNDFQTAEFLLEHGMIDRVVPRKELRGVLSSLMRIYRRSQPRAFTHPAMYPMMMPAMTTAEEMRYAG